MNLSDIFTKEEIKKIGEFASGKELSDEMINNTLLEFTEYLGEEKQTLLIPIIMLDDYPDLLVKITQEGGVYYCNFSDCMFPLVNPMEVYKIIVAKEKLFKDLNSESK